MIPLLISILVFFLLSFLLHEFSHLMAGFFQGATEGHIRVYQYKGIPSFYAYCNKVTNKNQYNLAGGLYSGLIFILMGCMALLEHAPTFYIPLLSFGVLQCVYGVYEWKYLPVLSKARYMKYHYWLYGIVLFSELLFWLFVPEL